MKKPTTVDEYIKQTPLNTHEILKKLRKTIKEAVPTAQERISYAMPYYHYNGRLVYFAVWKDHIGIYAISAPVINKFKKELTGLVITKGTIQFPLDKEIPFSLIKEIVKAQAIENESRKSS